MSPAFTPQHGKTGHLLSHDEFGQYVQHELAAMGIQTSHRAGLNLTIQLYGHDVALALEAAYAAYMQAPTQLDALVGGVISTTRTYTPDHLVDRFEPLRDRIFPMLKRLELLVSVREHDLPMLVYQDLPGDLMVTYVIHEAGSVSYINEQHLARWKTDAAALHNTAMHNLRQHTARLGPTILGDDTRRLLIFQAQDGYDATRLLLTEMLEQWQPLFSGQMVIGVPHRDMLLAFGDDDPQMLVLLSQQIETDMLQHPARLTEQLYTLAHGKLTTYPGHTPV
ncbi:MAG: DUF1444 family protein [Chloroflexaceae bacterium]|nr:DUF1444 family protein [Chloroflexaceae bacterium]NJO06715.1 DUF1444 family protein [Chloroflexaceae bacterium]